MRLLSQSSTSYEGTSRGLVVAIDFGTVFSSVAYAVLNPGKAPVVRTVLRYPGQLSKAAVPSILLYDHTGKVRARGAEVYDPEISLQADEEGWLETKFLKLLFHPTDKGISGVPSPVLPQGKTAIDVLADYLQYLQQAARAYIKNVPADGKPDLWDSVEHEIKYVFSHPNSWSGLQQSKMRQAATLAGLVPSGDAGYSRIRFVSEGEASLNWCIESGLAASSLKIGANIIVADVGGGTINVSSYRVESLEPLQVTEAKPAESHLAGSSFVDGAFRKYANGVLEGTRYEGLETLRRLTDEFERTTKPLFQDGSRKCPILFGARSDQLRSSDADIRSGRLIVPGETMEKFFEPSCSALVGAITAQISPGCVTAIFLVGGFSGNLWLHSELQRRLSGNKFIITRTDDDVAKAVAEGAVGFYLNAYVTARVAQFTYVIPREERYDPIDPQHISRAHLTYRAPLSGNLFVKGGLLVGVSKGIAVHEDGLHRVNYKKEMSTPSPWKGTFVLSCYRGSKDNIRWSDEDPDNIRDVCTFNLDLPQSCCHKTTGRGGLVYFQARFWVSVDFEAPELTCYVGWVEEGVLQRRPVSLSWNEG